MGEAVVLVLWRKIRFRGEAGVVCCVFEGFNCRTTAPSDVKKHMVGRADFLRRRKKLMSELKNGVWFGLVSGMLSTNMSKTVPSITRLTLMLLEGLK